jgi:flagellar biosynthesis anti-sigma factor FlgM
MRVESLEEEVGMKIHDKLPGSQDINPGTQKVAKSEVKDKVQAREKTISTDKIDISQKAKELSAAINQLPEIREDKVKAAKEAIEAGNYNVDPTKLAERILKEL